MFMLREWNVNLQAEQYYLYKSIFIFFYSSAINFKYFVFQGGANTRIKATIDKLDLPYNDNFDCYHWLEFRDYLIGDNGKE